MHILDNLLKYIHINLFSKYWAAILNMEAKIEAKIILNLWTEEYSKIYVKNYHMTKYHACVHVCTSFPL